MTPNIDKVILVIRNCTPLVSAPNSVAKDEATGVNVAIPSNFQIAAASDLTGSTESAANLHIPPFSQTGVALAGSKGGFRASCGSLSRALLCALFAPSVRLELEFSVQVKTPSNFSRSVWNVMTAGAAICFNSFVRT